MSAARFYIWEGRRQKTLPDTPEGREMTPAERHALKAFNTSVATANGVREKRAAIEAKHAKLYERVPDGTRETLVHEAVKAEMPSLVPDAARGIANAVTEIGRARSSLASLPPLVAYEQPTDPATAAVHAEMRAFLRSHADRTAFVHAAKRSDDDRVLAPILTAHPALSGVNDGMWAELHEHVVRVRHADEIADRERAVDAIDSAARAVENATSIIAEATGTGLSDFERVAIAATVAA